MQTSQEQANLYKAMIAARADIKTVAKDKQGYGYKYATLDSIIAMLDQALPKHGLGYTQFLTMADGKRALLTRIFHESGEWMENAIEMTDTDLSKANDSQKAGASITYFRRYALSAVFGIATDEDVDGNVQQAQAVRKQQQPSPKPQTAKPNALDIIRNDFKNRLGAGETQKSILKGYADMLKTDDVKPVQNMSEKEQAVLAACLLKKEN